MYISSIICSSVLLLIVFIAVAEKCTVSIFSHSIGSYRFRAISVVHFHLHLISLSLTLSLSLFLCNYFFFFFAVFASRRCQFLAAHCCQSRINSITICLGCCYSICGRLRTTGELSFLFYTVWWTFDWCYKWPIKSPSLLMDLHQDNGSDFNRIQPTIKLKTVSDQGSEIDFSTIRRFFLWIEAPLLKIRVFFSSILVLVSLVKVVCYQYRLSYHLRFVTNSIRSFSYIK